jgi:exportin-7
VLKILLRFAFFKLPLVGLARDLRGLTFAFNSRLSYLQLFDWIYPRYLQLFTKAVELWFNEAFVTTAILKLVAELVQNRSQRLIFDVSSPNGILLFREASKMVCTFGDRIADYNVPKEQFYSLKYPFSIKSICINITF